MYSRSLINCSRWLLNYIETVSFNHLDHLILLVLIIVKSCKFVLTISQEAVLTEQAKQERENPVAPKLKTFLQGAHCLVP